MEEDESRFAILEGPIDDFIDERENKNTRAKTGKHDFFKRDFRLVIFKTEVFPFSLQVFILHNCKHPQIRDAIYKLNEFDLAVFIIKFALAPEWLPIFEMRLSVRKNLSMYEIKTSYHRKC